MRVYGKAGSRNGDDVFGICRIAHRCGASDLPLHIVVCILAIPQLDIDIGARIGATVGSVKAFFRISAGVDRFVDAIVYPKLISVAAYTIPQLDVGAVARITSLEIQAFCRI